VSPMYLNKIWWKLKHKDVSCLLCKTGFKGVV